MGVPRYLLESSATDGYLLEDGSGVLQLEPTDAGAGSFTAGAIILVVPTGSFTVGAALFSVGAAALTGDAAIKATSAGAFTLAAVTRRLDQPGSVVADAVIRTTGAASFPASSVLLRQAQPGLVTANAAVLRTYALSLTADAVLRRAQAGAFVADAVTLRPAQPGSFAMSAVVTAAGAGSFTANALTLRPTPGSLTAEANLKATRTGSLTADAWVGTPFTTVTGSFTAAALLRRTTASSLTAGAWIKGTIYGSFTLAANLFGTREWRTWIPLNAVIAPKAVGSFTLDYRTYAPSLPPSGINNPPGAVPPANGTVGIAGAGGAVPVTVRIDGVDVTHHIEWATAIFTAKVNGAVGDCRFDVLDRDHTLEFSFGQEIQLIVDGIVRWGGWVLRPGRSFTMSVQPEPVTSPVIWRIEGIDYNAIFDKRVLYDLSNPGRTWNYEPGSWDDVVIRDIWNSFDMDGFTLYAERVGAAILDLPGVTAKGKQGGLLASAGYTLRDVLASIARCTAAIFYCSPTKVITYVDSDRVNSPYTLTDRPYVDMGYTPPANSIGYRGVKIHEDGSEMCNDALVWGAGYSSTVVFARHQDAVSQAAHGRWQKGGLTSGVYKQATVNAIATSFVEGSPAAHRAQKFPKRSVELITDSTVFGVGDVVNVACSPFAYIDVLPIRTAAITFPTPYRPRYALQMSWEIDADWSMYDPWLPVDTRPPCTDCGPCTDCEPGGCDCGITDTFTRTVAASSWGTSDSGLVWATTDVTFSVNGTSGELSWSSGSPKASLSFAGSTTISLRLAFKADGWAYGGSSGYAGVPVKVLGSNRVLWLTPGSNNGFPKPDGSIAIDGGAAIDFNWLTDTWYSVHLEYDNATGAIDANVWLQADAEPAGWMVSGDVGAGDDPITGIQLAGGTKSMSSAILTFDSLDITGVNRCSAIQFDDFNRTVTPASSSPTGPEAGAGIATPSGFSWNTQGCDSQRHIEVDGSQMVFYWSAVGSLGGLAYISAAGPWLEPSWTMRMRFTAFRPSGTSDANLTISAPSGYARLRLIMGIDDAVGTYPSGDIPFGWGDGTTYLVKWEVTWNGPERIKVWAETDPEPDWLYSTAFNDSGVPTSGNYQVGLTGSLDYSSSDALYIDYIEFDYAGKPCYPGGPVPGSGGNFSSGNKCDQLVPQGSPVGGVYESGTEWRTTTASYVPGATRLAFDGRFQFGNYDENDPRNGIITIHTAVDANTIVTLCYIANGMFP